VLAQIQVAGFRQMQATLTKGFDQLASALEWGFTDLCWKVEQQTEVLKDIDNTLKTPSETQANEYRKMAEELQNRGVLDEAEEFYSKALELNRLDFRIYIGLAETLLRVNRFHQARQVLEKSLPHAPKVAFELLDEPHETLISDWRSYSLRLIGHIDACAGDYRQAAASLSSAIEFSPFYAEALYDYAQYTARISEAASSIASLERAIRLNPLYWYLPQRQKVFSGIKGELKALLNSLRRDALRNAEEAIQACQNEIDRLGRTVANYQSTLASVAAQFKWSYWSRERSLVDALRKKLTQHAARLQDIRAASAKGDYSDLLAAVEGSTQLENGIRYATFAASSALEALRNVVQAKRRKVLAVLVTTAVSVFTVLALLIAIGLYHAAPSKTTYRVTVHRFVDGKWREEPSLGYMGNDYSAADAIYRKYQGVKDWNATWADR
jgi:tetratricopeptide (TPR) repeat protein